MRSSSLERARTQIISFFDNLVQHAFTLSQMTSVLEDNRAEWDLAQALTTQKFIQFLVDRGKLTIHKFRFPSQPTTLFLWEEPPVYEVAMLLRYNGYLSHLSAMQYHQLIDKDRGKVIYINVEQTPKPKPHGSLEQFRIDAAFQRPSRTTQNRTQVENYTFYLLSGKNTGMLGVNKEEVPEIAVPIRVTSLERTLIDIVVRPAYSGGVYGILDAYRKAARKVDIKLMAKILEQLQHIYPYHQAIGFFMERSQSYSRKEIDILDQYPKRFDFYADYEIVEAKYSPKWRIYYPSYLDSNLTKTGG